MVPTVGVATFETMINGEIRTLHEPDGTPVLNVAFDVSTEQLRAAVHAAGEIALERHRGQELDIDDVLALRELTSVRDELDHFAGAEANAHVVLPLARFIVLHDAVHEWADGREERGWARADDERPLAMTRAMLPEMDRLRARALEAALGESSPTT
jgi:hypothetical protein